MAYYYRVQHPEVYASLSPAERQKQESQPARVGYVNIETTLSREQQEVVRAIWGTPLTNKEYYPLLWLDLWNALPEWQKESEWPDEPYHWREPDPEHHSIPNDYILPEDRLHPNSSDGRSNPIPTTPQVILTGDSPLKPHFSFTGTQNMDIFTDLPFTKSATENISFMKNRTGAYGMGESDTQNVGSGMESLSQIPERFTVYTALKPNLSLTKTQYEATSGSSPFTYSKNQILIENRNGGYTIGESRIKDIGSLAR